MDNNAVIISEYWCNPQGFSTIARIRSRAAMLTSSEHEVGVAIKLINTSSKLTEIVLINALEGREEGRGSG